jgi:hypothetical protein
MTEKNMLLILVLFRKSTMQAMAALAAPVK